jgi:hypothetical protein
MGRTVGKAQATQEAREVRFVQPRVRLVAFTKDPYQLAVASARTCYAADFEFVGRVTPKGERSRTTLLGALPHLEAELAEIGRLDVPHDMRILRVDALLLQLPTDDLRAALQEFANQARIRAEGNASLAHSIYEAATTRRSSTRRSSSPSRTSAATSWSPSCTTTSSTTPSSRASATSR